MSEISQDKGSFRSSLVILYVLKVIIKSSRNFRCLSAPSFPPLSSACGRITFPCALAGGQGHVTGQQMATEVTCATFWLGHLKASEGLSSPVCSLPREHGRLSGRPLSLSEDNVGQLPDKAEWACGTSRT